MPATGPQIASALLAEFKPLKAHINRVRTEAHAVRAAKQDAIMKPGYMASIVIDWSENQELFKTVQVQSAFFNNKSTRSTQVVLYCIYPGCIVLYCRLCLLEWWELWSCSIE